MIRKSSPTGRGVSRKAKGWGSAQETPRRNIENSNEIDALKRGVKGEGKGEKGKEGEP